MPRSGSGRCFGLEGRSCAWLKFWFPPTYALQGDFQLSLDEEPRWIFHINDALSHFAATAGLPLVIVIAAVEAAIGVGVLTRHRRAALTAGIALSVIYWIIGQQLAGLLTGSSTDIASGPLYILLALTVWPTAARITGTGSDRPRSPRVGLRHRPSRARRARRALPL